MSVDKSNCPENNTISKTTSVGKLLAEQPLRADVLDKYNIDYCCGGKASLEDACVKNGLNVEEVLEKLRAADSSHPLAHYPDWMTASLAKLSEHIIETYHKPLRQDLNRIALLAEKVARVHGKAHPEMLEVLRVFRPFRAKLELHMQKEEMVLFPGIVSLETTGSPQGYGCNGGIEHPIEVMEHEHEEAGDALAQFRRLTCDYVPPPDACSSFELLLSSLAQVEANLHVHVHLENNILFPRALELRKPTKETKH